MNLEVRYPTGILSQYVKYYWILETDISDGEVSERVVPLGSVEMFFHYRKTLHVKRSNGEIFDQPQTFISGISNSYADVSVQDEAGLISVMFYPHSAGYFINIPLNEIENQAVNLDNFYKQEIRDIEEKLLESSSTDKKIAVIENFLVNRFFHNEQNKNDINLIKNSVECINNRFGVITSFELADKMSVCQKNLERKFSKLVGKTPKQYIKIIRFQNVIKNFQNITTKNFTSLAYEHGFFDQAHFINDFKNYSGYTPKEFIKKYNKHLNSFIDF